MRGAGQGAERSSDTNTGPGAEGHEMRANRRRRLNRNVAEQLLRGGSACRPAGQPADRDALAGLLAAAAASAHDRELGGEAEAAMAFRRALPGPAHQPRRPSMSATKLLAAKAILAAAGVTGGGVALAAVTGHLPSNLTGTPAAARSATSLRRCRRPRRAGLRNSGVGQLAGSTATSEQTRSKHPTREV